MIGFATLKGFEKGPGRRKHLRRAGLLCNLALRQNTLHSATVRQP